MEMFFISLVLTAQVSLNQFMINIKTYFIVFIRKIFTPMSNGLEIMPLAASKSNAIKQLQKLLKCDKLVVFGDGKNDIDMFELADESYAVQNAHEELKKYATAIISSNDEDAVAHWLEKKLYLTDSSLHG